MNAKLRSISGALLMLVIIPVVAGLLACMPVPIGNPERSRVDPDLNGVWIIESEGDANALYLFQPWDKRTWLVAAAMIAQGPDYDGEELELDTHEQAQAVLREVPVGPEGITSPDTVIYKAWLTKLGGVHFMTWEPMAGFNDDGTHTPEYWFVWRVDKGDADRFSLRLLVPEHEIFEDIVTPDEYEGDDYVRDTRRKWERALARAARKVDEDEIFGDPAVLARLPEDLLDEASELFQEVIEFESN